MKSLATPIASAVVLAAFASTSCGGQAEPKTADTELASTSSAAADADDPKIADPAEPDTADTADATDTAADGEEAAAADDEGIAETRTTEAITKIVKENRKGARACYEQVLQDVPGLKGDLVITFVLNPDGSMKHAELNEARSTIKEPKLANCVIEVIRHLDFPESSRGMETKVNYPFNFNP